MDMTEVLTGFMESGGDWERKRSSVPGVSILRLPPTKNRSASLAVEINPRGEDGRPMKRRGVLIVNRREFLGFRELFNDERVEGLLSRIESVAPAQRAGVVIKEEDILNI